MSIKLLALAASYRNDSLNRKLLAHAVKLAHGDGAKVTIIDYEECESIVYLGDDAPLPPGANKLAEALLAHQGLLLASPEYNWSVPGSLKNLIDWLSVDRRAPLAGKTALLMCASPSTRGGISGLQHLRVPLELLGTWVYPQMVGIGSAAGKFEGDELIRDKDQQHLADCVRGFIRATGALTHAA